MRSALHTHHSHLTNAKSLRFALNYVHCYMSMIISFIFISCAFFKFYLKFFNSIPDYKTVIHFFANASDTVNIQTKGLEECNGALHRSPPPYIIWHLSAKFHILCSLKNESFTKLMKIFPVHCTSFKNISYYNVSCPQTFL